MALMVTGCRPLPSPEPPASMPTIQASVQTDDGLVAVAHDGNVLGLYTIDEGVPTKLTEKTESGKTPTVHLLTFGGETGQTYNSFVFGIAPAGAVRISLAAPGPMVGGEVVNGTFVVAMTAKDLAPGALNWAFLSADGQVVEEGSGIRD